MKKKINITRVNFFIILFLILGGIYSFGTFGFLNLFGARTLFQIVYVCILLPIAFFILQSQKLPKKKTYAALVFFGLMGFGGIANSNVLTAPIESVIILFLLLIISLLSNKEIIRIARYLVVITSILCAMVLTAYLYYFLNPDEFLRANFHIYDSTVGAKKIFPSYFMDWVSFTSGDGFVAFGQVMHRMKGYSNEPSATIVHYLAPTIFAFLLGGRYCYLGIFILIVNVIAIASFISHIIIAISFAFFVLFIIAKRYSNLLFYLGILLLVLLLLSPSIMLNLFSTTSDLIGSDFDLIQRKIGDGSSESNLAVRQNGMINGLILLVMSPFGYPSSELGAGAGLVYIVSSYAGWFGIAILFFYTVLLLKRAFFWLKYGRVSLHQKYAFGLTLSIILIAFFVSGYGWSRPVGFIILILLYRFYVAFNNSIDCK